MLSLGNYGVVWYPKTEELIGHANFPIRSLVFCLRDMFRGSIPIVEFRRKISLLHRGGGISSAFGICLNPNGALVCKIRFDIDTADR
jgi:hypothetical protein